MKLTQAQIQVVAAAVGMKDPKTMAAIAMAESGGDASAHNATPPDDSYGLWQINMIGQLGPSRRKAYGISKNSDLYNPFVNARAAKKILDSQGLSAWSVYTSGAYRQYLNKATTVTQADWEPFKDWNDPFDVWPDDGVQPPPSVWEWLTGQTPPESAEGAVDGIGDVVGQITRIGDILAKTGDWLSDPSNWVRIAYVIGGAALVVGGLVLVGRPLAEAAAASTPAGTVRKFAKG